MSTTDILRINCLNSKKRKEMKSEQNANKKTKTIIVQVDIMNADEISRKGIVINIKRCHVCYAKLETVTIEKQGKIKKYSGYDTSVNGVKSSPVYIC